MRVLEQSLSPRHGTSGEYLARRFPLVSTCPGVPHAPLFLVACGTSEHPRDGTANRHADHEILSLYPCEPCPSYCRHGLLETGGVDYNKQGYRMSDTHRENGQTPHPALGTEPPDVRGRFCVGRQKFHNHSHQEKRSRSNKTLYLTAEPCAKTSACRLRSVSGWFSLCLPLYLNPLYNITGLCQEDYTDWGTEPAVPVLWALIPGSSAKPPFGTVISMD